ncbi:MAG: TIGR04283 family arsenosugar biosynthesis glycosyltransferase [Pseudomonadota bacterium]
MTTDLSVIIPVINEGRAVNGAIDRLVTAPFNRTMEILVVDGHPDGSTISVINNKDVICLTAAAGRGNQMNQGALVARGRILVFLHCDTCLPEGGLDDIVEMMKSPSLQAGAFDLAIDKKNILFRIIEQTASLRSRISRIPYGDQAIFIKKDYFFLIGQYANIPIMEDVDLMQRIKKNRGRIGFINKKALTSARRWEKEGVLFCTLRNWMLMTLFLCGVAPERLARLYKTQKF